jgi:hypothetical protein
MFILKIKFLDTLSVKLYRLTMYDRPVRLRHFFANYYLLINYHLLVSVIYRKNKYKKTVKVIKRQLRQLGKNSCIRQEVGRIVTKKSPDVSGDLL